MVEVWTEMAVFWRTIVMEGLGWIATAPLEGGTDPTLTVQTDLSLISQTPMSHLTEEEEQEEVKSMTCIK